MVKWFYIVPTQGLLDDINKFLNFNPFPVQSSWNCYFWSRTHYVGFYSGWFAQKEIALMTMVENQP